MSSATVSGSMSHASFFRRLVATDFGQNGTPAATSNDGSDAFGTVPVLSHPARNGSGDVNLVIHECRLFRLDELLGDWLGGNHRLIPPAVAVRQFHQTRSGSPQGRVAVAPHRCLTDHKTCRATSQPVVRAVRIRSWIESRRIILELLPMTGLRPNALLPWAPACGKTATSKPPSKMDMS